MFLVRFEILSVQDIISRSRSTRDWMAASRLISGSMKTVWEDIEKCPVGQGPALLVPGAGAVNGAYSFPDQIVFFASHLDGLKKTDLIEKVEKAFLSRLNNSQTVTADLTRFQYGYAAVEINAGESSAPVSVSWDDMDKLNQASFFEKMNRTARPLNSKMGSKCSLCNEADEITSCPEYAVDLKMAEKLKDQNTLLKKGEHLCSFCYQKRKYGFNLKGTVPSTRDLSLYPEKAFYLKRDGTDDEDILKIKIANGCVESLKSIRAERFSPERLKDAEVLKPGVSARDPIVYFAAMVFDFDHFGETVSGKNLREDKRADLDFKKWMETLDSAISAFSNALSEELKGFDKDSVFSIYKGGDDFQFLCSVDQAVPLLTLVSGLFEEYVASVLGPFLHDSPSLSGACVIVHEKYPLRQVIELSHTFLDQYVKNEGVCNRGSFGINAVISGAQEIVFGGKWAALSCLECMQGLFSEIKLSPSFFKEMEEESDRFFYKERGGKIIADGKMSSLFTDLFFYKMKRHSDAAAFAGKKIQATCAADTLAALIFPSKLGQRPYGSEYDPREALRNFLRLVPFLRRLIK